MSAGRLTLVGFGVALVSLAVFGYFLYQGLALSTRCGLTCNIGDAGTGISDLSDYLYGVAALLVGQATLAVAILLNRSSPG